MKSIYFTTALMVLTIPLLAQEIPAGFTSLFDGKTLANWKIPVGDNGHWKIKDNVIDYDAESEAKDRKDLWSEKEDKDFVLYVDWRIKETPWKNAGVPILLPAGLPKLGGMANEI